MSIFRLLFTLGILCLGLLAAGPGMAQLPQVWRGHKDPILAVAFSGDGKTVATFDATGRVVFWDTANGNQRSAFKYTGPAPVSLALNADGTVLAAGCSDGIIRLLAPADGKEIGRSERQSGAIHSLAYDANHGRLAAGSGVFAGLGNVTSMAAGDVGRNWESREPQVAVQAIAWSPSGHLVAAGGGRVLRPGELRLLRAGDGTTAAIIPGFHDIVKAVAFSPDGNTVAAAGREGVIRLFNVADGKPVRNIGPIRGEVLALSFAQEGKRIVAVLGDGLTQIFDAANGRLTATFCTPRIATRAAAAFTRDGNRLAIGSNEGDLRIYDVPALEGWQLADPKSHRPCDKIPCDAPNIILIVADDLGWGDLSPYGQEKIRTPHAERMAQEGMRFDHYYAGAPTGNAARCVMMTGVTTGHARIRGNAPAVPLALEDLTLGEVLRTSGYATAAVGRWSLGDENTTGMPLKQGFDQYFGALSRPLADNYYPEFLFRDNARVNIPGNAGGMKKEYAPDLLTLEALTYIRKHRHEPFFLHLAYSIPHAKLEVPGENPYANENWPAPMKTYAHGVTRLDKYLGRILDELAAQKIDERTLVIFTSDNGPHFDDGVDPKFFNSTYGLRGAKGNLYEGGVRVPMIMRWPRHIRPRTITNQTAIGSDLLPTFAELAGARMLPVARDGASLAPLMRGGDLVDAGVDRPIYIETHEGGFKQSVRFGDWKAIRAGLAGAIELYNLADDPNETKDLSATKPNEVEQARKLLDTSRSPSPDWPVAGEK